MTRSADTGPAWSTRSLAALALALALPLGAGAIGAAATLPSIPTWYAGLAKPPFTPPNAVFGPVWTALYGMMGVAFWRVLRLGAGAPRKGAATVLFLIQLALNALWSVLFFGLRHPLLGLVDILALDVTVLATIAAFWRLDRPAAMLLVPYAAWIGYATALNGAILWMNPAA